MVTAPGWLHASVGSRYAKFLSVGGMNAVIDIAVYNLLYVLWPTRSLTALSLYNSVAVLCAIANSYWWNCRWTFRDLAQGSWRERVLFVVQAVFNLGVNDLVLVLASALLTLYKPMLSPLLENNAPKVIGMVVSSSLSYILLQTLVFGRAICRPRAEGDRPQTASVQD